MKINGIGVFLVIMGGAGLAQIQMDANGCFWLYAVIFSIGVGMCLWSKEP